MKTGQVIKTLQHEHTSEITCLCLINNSDQLLLASGSLDNTIKIWNLTTGKCIKTFEQHTKGIQCLLFLNNDQILVTGSKDTTIKLWNINNGQLIKTLDGHTNWINCLILINNKTFASASDDFSIKIWSKN